MLRWFPDVAPPAPYSLLVVDGRVLLVPFAMHHQRQTSSSSGNGRNIRWEYSHRNNETTLNWSAKSDKLEETVSIQSDGNTSVRAMRKPLEGSSEPPLSFTQSPGKPLEFRVGEGDGAKAWTADTLWLLLLQCPEECETRLFPLLGEKQIALDFEVRYAPLRDALLQTEVEQSGSKRWEALVKQLNDDSFARREAADRALRAGGAGARHFLGGLDLTKLQPEQQYRIARMLREQGTTMAKDRLPKVVKSLRSDPRAWIALLADADEAVRRRAADKLELLLGREIEFDPTADATTREEQIKVILKTQR